MITRYRVDIPKEVLDNIPTFDRKPGELNQFLSTIESYSTMYRICNDASQRKSTQNHTPHTTRRRRHRMVSDQKKTHK